VFFWRYVLFQVAEDHHTSMGVTQIECKLLPHIADLAHLQSDKGPLHPLLIIGYSCIFLSLSKLFSVSL